MSTVRHALALDERRGWFDATTWGWLDSDRGADASMSRLEDRDVALIKQQDVAEVWFSGCHADVGGGGRSAQTSDIALRWMLGEAANEGLKLNATGRGFLAMPRASEIPAVDDSHTASWRWIERLPRRAINNGGRWPRRYWAPLGAAPRTPLAHGRDKKVLVHESATDLLRLGSVPDSVTVERVSTLRTVKAIP